MIDIAPLTRVLEQTPGVTLAVLSRGLDPFETLLVNTYNLWIPAVRGARN